jgi:TolB-like protein
MNDFRRWRSSGAPWTARQPLPPARAGDRPLHRRPAIRQRQLTEFEYFSDGMTGEVISALANVTGLRVASRTSVFAGRH